jgi:hypothetical protein
LVFDDDSENEQKLIAAVRNRKKGQGIVEALLNLGLETLDSIEDKKSFGIFMGLIDGTPELSLYSRQMWLRHEKALGKTIHKEAKKKVSLLEAEAVARFALDSYHRAMGESQSKASLRSLFAILKNGWDG